MKCTEVMTANPSCCLPGDSVATAAQIMRREDVGPVLVVSSHDEKRLVGIVTDRDLAMKVIAEGRDAHSCRVDEVMSPNPVTCSEDDDVGRAIQRMADHQIRRIPIVDHNGRLAGIVAQADVARFADEEQVGEMVEEISQPYGSGEWSEEYSGSRAGLRDLAIGALCFSAGLGFMYLMDMDQGRRRRALLAQGATGALNTSRDVVQRKTKDLRNRAQGLVAETKSRLRHESVDDHTVVERVRSKMGREVSHPSALHVSSTDGHVTVSGPILADEAEGLLSRARAVPGVKSVEDRLERHQTAGNHPALQGGHVLRERNAGWSPTTRVLASAAGGGLLLYGMKSKGKLAKASATAGLGLLARGIANRDIGELRASIPGMGNLARDSGF